MTTYTDEVNIYNPEAVGEGIVDAGKTATNYITTVNNDGIVVADAGNGASSGSITSGTTGWHIGGVLEFIRQGVSRFWIGLKNSGDTTPTVRIGKAYVQGATDNESHMELDYHSLQMVDKNGNTYFHVSDLRDENGVATVEETFGPAFFYAGERYNCNLTVTSVVSLIGSDSNDYTARVSGISGKQLQFSPSLPLTVDMTLTYTTESAEAKAFTFGTRTAGNVGHMSMASGVGNRAEAPYSAAFGSGNRARGEGSLAHGIGSIAWGKSSQASGTSCYTYKNAEGAHAFGVGVNAYADGGIAIGRYNSGTAAALSVGNGTSNNDRSDAFTVDWDGEIFAAKPIPIASGGTGATTAAGARTALGLGSFATRSSLGVAITSKDGSVKDSSARSSGANYQIDITLAAESGYMPIAVVAVSTNSGQAFLRGFDLDGISTGGTPKVKTYWRANAAMSANTVTYTAQVMLIKTTLP